MTKSKNVVFHKTTCITCKRTISELERLKIDFNSRDFFKEPFTESEFKKIIKLSGKKPVEFLRKRDKMYKELSLSTKKISDSEIVKLMIKYPGLILRPIILRKGKVIVGKLQKDDFD